MTIKQLASILRVNAVDSDKELPLKECMKRFESAPKSSQELWLNKARQYLKESKK